jgi:hypothetical protein
MRLCFIRRSHFSRADFILQLSANQRTIILQCPAMALELCLKKKESKMLKNLLGAAAIAALAFAAAPAQAAHVGGVGCSGVAFAKTESAIETAADGDNKWAAEKEIAAAQDAFLNNKFGACSSHLNKALRVSAAK